MSDKKIRIKEYIGWKKTDLAGACEFYKKAKAEIKNMVFEWHFEGVTEEEIINYINKE